MSSTQMRVERDTSTLEHYVYIEELSIKEVEAVTLRLCKTRS